MMYAEQILQGKKTIEDVPERWRAEVEEILGGGADE
jgi:hypothetical protein